MRNNKYLLRVSVFALLMLFAIPLFAKQQSNSKAQADQLLELKDELNNLKKEIDTLKSTTIPGAIQDSLDCYKKSVIKEQNTKHKSRGNIIPWISLVISLITLIFVWFYKKFILGDYIKYKCGERLDNSRRLQEMSKNIEILQNAILQLRKSNPNITSDMQHIDSRLNGLEEELFKTRNELNRLTNQSQTECYKEKEHSSVKAPADVIKKSGYAKINTDKYFTEIYQSNNEVCVYKIDFISDNKGEFDIISLQKVKSRNDWQSIVEYSGNCTISEAQTYSVIEKGICEKKSGENLWEVTKKLKISISK